MMPDTETWEKHVTERGLDDEERRREFAEEMAEQTNTALNELKEVDAEKYEVSVKGECGRLTVWSDGWEMDVDAVLRLRDALRDWGVGDGSVAVNCNSGSPEEEVHRGELPPGVPRGVTVELWSDVERGDETLEMIRGGLDDVMRASE